MSEVTFKLAAMGGIPWKPTRELTRDLRGGWVMRVRGRGDLGRIEQRGHGRTATYVPFTADGRELDHSPTLSAAAAQLWAQPLMVHSNTHLLR